MGVILYFWRTWWSKRPIRKIFYATECCWALPTASLYAFDWIWSLRAFIVFINTGKLITSIMINIWRAFLTFSGSRSPTAPRPLCGPRYSFRWFFITLNYFILVIAQDGRCWFLDIDIYLTRLDIEHFTASWQPCMSYNHHTIVDWHTRAAEVLEFIV